MPYSNTTSFSMVSQGEEFANEVEEVLNMRLYSGSVLVVWKWTCDDTTCDDTTMFTENSEESYNNIIVQDSDDEDNVSNEGEAVDTVICMATAREHTITFKCIGATRDQAWQQSLRAARDKLEKGIVIPVRLKPEPNNVRDSKAIVFECYLEGKWFCIGYIVQELLDEVHDVIKKGLIARVEFDWIKYKTNWTYSGPGYFAGISITKLGFWSDKVVACQSGK